jgi:uncharacterized protein (DUF2235 family)
MADKKNIVICCDGTGNEFGDNNSNVVKLYATLDINEKQIGYYHPGVGTMGAPSANNKLEEKWSVVKGMAFGAGLMPNVGDAYRYLMNLYNQGDDIYLFGFSRGAYTARALAGVLHMFGLLCPGNDGLIPYVTRMFARVSRELALHKNTFTVAEGFKKAFSRDAAVHFVGVWDTVSSVGWIYDPVALPFSARNPHMKIGRHAVSIDERRCFFRDNLWGQPFEPGEPHYPFDVKQDIKQVWFAGVHSDIGGSYLEAESGLSKLTLEWMLREASLAGLIVDRDRATTILGRTPLPAGERSPYAKPDPAAPIHNSLKGAWWPIEFFPHQYYDKQAKAKKWRIPLGARRFIPADKSMVMHESVQQRLDAGINYNPPNLPAGRLEEHFTIEKRIEFPGAQGRAHITSVGL